MPFRTAEDEDDEDEYDFTALRSLTPKPNAQYD
jgi:hypothetical protein